LKQQPHYRLGSQVAKALTQLPDIQADSADCLAGNFVRAIRAMPCTFTI
jgi:hypothetical protein